MYCLAAGMLTSMMVVLDDLNCCDEAGDLYYILPLQYEKNSLGGIFSVYPLFSNSKIEGKCLSRLRVNQSCHHVLLKIEKISELQS